MGSIIDQKEKRREKDKEKERERNNDRECERERKIVKDESRVGKESYGKIIWR